MRLIRTAHMDSTDNYCK
uniref:Uncharacterized protein n=1 Tax=Arundo donax TaxID=35708 RepID=A0A0A9A9M9_ARUDO